MIREIILVEIVCSSTALTKKSKGFTDTEKAENYFTELVKEVFPTIEQDDIDNALDDGYFDFVMSYPDGSQEQQSVTIKEISFEDDGD